MGPLPHRERKKTSPKKKKTTNLTGNLSSGRGKRVLVEKRGEEEKQLRYQRKKEHPFLRRSLQGQDRRETGGGKSALKRQRTKGPGKENDFKGEKRRRT